MTTQPRAITQWPEVHDQEAVRFLGLPSLRQRAALLAVLIESWYERFQPSRRLRAQISHAGE